MKPAFIEEFHNAEPPSFDDQTLHESYDFDWDELYERLGESVQEKETAGRDDFEEMQRLCFAIRRIFSWLLNGEIKQGADKVAGRRLIALAWVLHPSLLKLGPDVFKGESPSLTTLSHTLGFKTPVLSVIAADVRREFGIRNRAQAHGWSFKENKAA